MIIIVKKRIEPLGHVAHALAALIGSGVANTFKNPQDPKHPDPFGIPPTDAIEVLCDDGKAGYAKRGFYEAGFEVPTGTGAAHDPGDQDKVTLTVTPSLEDNLKNYPIGIGQGAILSAKALLGAYVTRPIGPNNDPYTGDDPDTSIQVCCNRADIPRA